MGHFWSSQTGYTTPTYEWKVNGTVVGTNSNELNYDEWLIGTNNILCKITEGGHPTLTSNTIYISVVQKVLPSVSITASDENVSIIGNQIYMCSENSYDVYFIANPSFGGSSPTYTWRKNFSVVGYGQTYWPEGNISNGDTIDVIMTSNVECPIYDTVGSEIMVINITPSLSADIAIVSDTNFPVPMGSPVYMHVSYTQASGTTIGTIFKWYVNGNHVWAITGCTGSEVHYGINFEHCDLNNNDVVRCSMITDYSCLIGPNIVPSNEIEVTVLECDTRSLTILHTEFSIDGQFVQLYKSELIPPDMTGDYIWYELIGETLVFISNTHEIDRIEIQVNEHQKFVCTFNCIDGCNVRSNTLEILKPCVKDGYLEIFYPSLGGITYPNGYSWELQGTHSCARSLWKVSLVNKYNSNKSIIIGYANMNNIEPCTGIYPNQLCNSEYGPPTGWTNCYRYVQEGTGVTLTTIENWNDFPQCSDYSNIHNLTGDQSRYWFHKITQDEINSIGNSVKIQIDPCDMYGNPGGYGTSGNCIPSYNCWKQHTDAACFVFRKSTGEIEIVGTLNFSTNSISLECQE